MDTVVLEGPAGIAGPSQPQPASPPPQEQPAAASEMLSGLDDILKDFATSEAPQPSVPPSQGPAPHKGYSGSLRLLVRPYPPDPGTLERAICMGRALNFAPTGDGTGLQMDLDLSEQRISAEKLVEAIGGGSIKAAEEHQLTIGLGSKS